MNPMSDLLLPAGLAAVFVGALIFFAWATRRDAQMAAGAIIPEPWQALAPEDMVVVPLKEGNLLLAPRNCTIQNVTRFEVIDHRPHPSHRPEFGIVRGRVLVVYDTAVKMDVQDEGRTLKIFLENQP